MKVIIFGATGSIGELAVKNCLQDGHKVIAFARNPEKLDIQNPNLALHKGDATRLSDVMAGMAGADAAIITLGAGKSRKGTVRSEGTLTIIQAMHELGIKRLICQSTLGAHESWSNLNFFWKYIMFGALLRPVFLDHEKQENLVRASGLDWTIVRPSAFIDAGPTPYKISFGPEIRNLKLTIPRLDVARFLAEEVRRNQFLHQAVAISN
ncbi:MAG: NAD(P)H-binding protein [Sneathiella sp.]|nr:NAD(P)H-binding protein [Sneathiella sp.]